MNNNKISVERKASEDQKWTPTLEKSLQICKLVFDGKVKWDKVSGDYFVDGKKLDYGFMSRREASSKNSSQGLLWYQTEEEKDSLILLDLTNDGHQFVTLAKKMGKTASTVR